MNQNQEKFYTILSLARFDAMTVKEAMSRFRAYKERSVITSGNFDDEAWSLSDEYANYCFDFKINGDDFSVFGSYLKISCEEFIRYLKVYIVYQMGLLALGTLRGIIHEVKEIIKCPIAKLSSITNTYTPCHSNKIAEFISMLPPENREEEISVVMEQLDTVEEIVRSSTKPAAPRTLAAFESYFRFGEILDLFWRESDDEQEKLFYFPIWMWWHVTGVLPMRPREYILTPRNCLSTADGKWYLVILRNRIKGSGKTKDYTIKKDYKRCRYEIPESLAKEIKWYLEKTNDLVGNDLNTLFIADPHYAQWERCKPYTSRYLTYSNLCTCLRYFFEQIVSNRYGYTIVYERDTTSLPHDKCVNYLHLGDTRHIAMINLIAEGATPTVTMMLAGHDDPYMSSFYFSNLSTMVECKTYRQYKKQIQGKQVYVLSKQQRSLQVGEFVLLEDNSRCYSERVRQGDFTDCKKVCGPAGEIGYCVNCVYHRDKDERFRDGKDRYINRIENESKALNRIVAKVRSTKGKTESILQALLRLREAEYSYQQYLTERLNEDAEKENANVRGTD